MQERQRKLSVSFGQIGRWSQDAGNEVVRLVPSQMKRHGEGKEERKSWRILVGFDVVSFKMRGRIIMYTIILMG